MKIEYRNADTAWEDFKILVSGIITDHAVSRVAEAGAGANPLLPLDFVKEHQLVYDLIDHSAAEMEKAADGYNKLVLDLTHPVEAVHSYDLVIAQMTLEHIAEPAVFFDNIRRLLRPGGRACLFFAAVTNLPMMVNRTLPHRLSHRLLMNAQPFRRNEKHGKFPAFYRWCFGPTRPNIRRILSTELVIEQYSGYFGHTYYRRYPVLPALEKIKTGLLLRYPNPWLCSYSQVVLRAPSMPQ